MNGEPRGGGVVWRFDPTPIKSNKPRFAIGDGSSLKSSIVTLLLDLIFSRAVIEFGRLAETWLLGRLASR